MYVFFSSRGFTPLLGSVSRNVVCSYTKKLGPPVEKSSPPPTDKVGVLCDPFASLLLITQPQNTQHKEKTTLGTDLFFPWDSPIILDTSPIEWHSVQTNVDKQETSKRPPHTHEMVHNQKRIISTNHKVAVNLRCQQNIVWSIVLNVSYANYIEGIFYKNLDWSEPTKHKKHKYLLFFSLLFVPMCKNIGTVLGGEIFLVLI